MTYLPNIPMATDFLSVSQGQINTNFTLLNSVYGVDHSSFASPNFIGYHKAIHMLNFSNPATVANVGIMFSNTVSSINTTAPFYKDGPPSGNGAVKGLTFCGSGSLSINGTAVPIPNIIGNVSGTLIIANNSGLQYATYSFFQKVTGALQSLTLLGGTSFGPGLSWSSATPSSIVTLRFNPTSVYDVSYSVIFTYTQ